MLSQGLCSSLRLDHAVESLSAMHEAATLGTQLVQHMQRQDLIHSSVLEPMSSRMHCHISQASLQCVESWAADSMRVMHMQLPVCLWAAAGKHLICCYSFRLNHAEENA